MRYDAQKIYGQAAIGVRSSEAIRVALLLLQDLPDYLTENEAAVIEECAEKIATFSARVARKIREQKNIVAKMAHHATAAETWFDQLPEFLPEEEVDKLLPLMKNLQAAAKGLNEFRDEKVKLAAEMEVEHTKAVKRMRGFRNTKDKKNTRPVSPPTKKELAAVVMEDPQTLFKLAAQEIKEHEAKKKEKK